MDDNYRAFYGLLFHYLYCGFPTISPLEGIAFILPRDILY